MAVIYDRERNKWYGVADEAKKLGISSGHLHQCLSGKRAPGKKLAKKIVVKEVA